MTRYAGAVLGMVFLAHAASAQFVQQGSKLVGTGGASFSEQGQSVAISADGNTALIGGNLDNVGVGAVWVFTRSGGVWSQQGSKLVGTGAAGGSEQGQSVAISADGNTAIVGGLGDSYSVGATWVFTRSGGVWSQQGSKLVGTGAVTSANQGTSVAISADGNTAIVGGPDDYADGAAWVFTRSGGVWSQQGSKLVGTGAAGAARQGSSVAISADGNTVIVGGPNDNFYTYTGSTGATWVFTRNGGVWSQQGSKLVGTGAVGGSEQGTSVAISADGNTVLVGGKGDSSVTYTGATWVFTRSGGVWSEQGNKLVGTGATGGAEQGSSVAISADGNTALVGGYSDNSDVGATWAFRRSGGVWSQLGSKLVGTGAVRNAWQGTSVAISADATTAIVGGWADNGSVGAAWVFVANGCSYSISPTNASVGAAGGNGTVNVAVTSGSGCAWGASPSAPWIHVTSGSTGSGNGTVGYSVDANTGGSRAGTIAIANQIFTLTQGPSSSVIVFSDDFEGAFPGSWKLYYGTGTESTTLWGKSSYRAVGGSHSAWCAGGGSSPQPPGGNYLPNMNVWLAYGPFDLSDATDATVDFDLWSNVDPGASNSYPDWIGLYVSTDGFNTSPWGFSYTNTGQTWQHGTFNFKDVTQVASIGAHQVYIAFIFGSDGSTQYEGSYIDNVVIKKTVGSAPCTYNLNPTSQSVSTGGGSGSVAVTTGTACAWTAASQASWIGVTSGGSGSGNGTVAYSVQANGGSARAGTITVAGQTFTVNQSAGGSSYAYLYWLPVASHVSGLNQSQWRSDLGLLNTGSVAANVQLKFFGSSVVSTTTYVAPGAQSILIDVVDQLNASGSGPIEVLSDQPLKVTTRTYNLVSSSASCYPNGTQGQAYPVVASGDGLGAGQSAYLAGLTENASYRCNIGVVNTGTQSATVLVELFDGAGRNLASYTVSLAAGQWAQPAQPFLNVAGQTAMDRGYARVTAQTGSGVFAFASVIDNITNDPTPVTMQR